MECSTIPSRVIASCFSIVGFVAALFIGFAAGLSTSTILSRAIVVMMVCWPVGRLLGHFAQRAVEENVAQYKKAHPIPRDFAAAGAGDGEGGGGAGVDVNVDVVDDEETVAEPVTGTEVGSLVGRSRA